VLDNEDEPLNDAAREYLQQRIDRMYDAFVADISRGRGISVETIKGDFESGLVVDAREALEKRMIDHIVPTLGDALAFADTYVARHASARREADVDYMRCAIALAERSLSRSSGLNRRAEADADYIAASIRIRERL
jgi:ClpP class serine protease